MHEDCQSRGIRLLILDIPGLEHTTGIWGSSIPRDLRDSFVRHSDALIGPEETLERYRGVAEIVVPHGEHHISETTHLLLGMAVAEQIAAWRKAEPAR